MKIKKYALHILVLIALIGLFGPVSKVDASPYSDCIAFENTLGEPDPGSCDGLEGGPRGATAAAACSSLVGIGNLICKIHKILNSIIPVLLALGVVYFVWGVVQYMIGGGDESKKKGKDHIIYGLIGLSVIVGLWGLVNIVVNTFGLKGATPSGLNINGTVGSSCVMGTNFQGLLGYFTCIINNSVIPLIFALAVLMFVWGVVQFVINSDEEAKKEKGKQFMLWGIIALTVMISVWGLVGILSSTFGIKGSVLPQVTPPSSP